MNISTYNYFNSVSRLSQAISSARQTEEDGEAKTLTQKRTTVALNALDPHITKNIFGQQKIHTSANTKTPLNMPIPGFTVPATVSYPTNFSAFLTSLQQLENIRFNPARVSEIYQNIAEQTQQVVEPEAQESEEKHTESAEKETRTASPTKDATPPPSRSTQGSSASSSKNTSPSVAVSA